jgi:hypothetical protein
MGIRLPCKYGACHGKGFIDLRRPYAYQVGEEHGSLDDAQGRHWVLWYNCTRRDCLYRWEWSMVAAQVDKLKRMTMKGWLEHGSKDL